MPVKYLGTMVDSKKLSIKEQEIVFDKVQSKLDSWASNSVSQAGKVGNGKDISILNDPWISNIPIGKWPTFVNIREISSFDNVSQLIKGNDWDYELLINLFGSIQSSIIGEIYIPKHEAVDRWIWSKNNSGILSCLWLLEGKNYDKEHCNNLNGFIGASLWHLRKNRNKAFFEKKRFGVNTIFSKALADVSISSKLSSDNEVMIARGQTIPAPIRPIHKRQTEIYCDAAWFTSLEKIGIGVFIKNHEGLVIDIWDIADMLRIKNWYHLKRELNKPADSLAQLGMHRDEFLNIFPDNFCVNPSLVCSGHVNATMVANLSSSLLEYNGEESIVNVEEHHECSADQGDGREKEREDGSISLTFKPYNEPAQLVGFATQSVDVSISALLTMYKLNVGGQYLPPINDSGLSRTWYDDTPYIYEASFSITFSANDNVTIQYPDGTPNYVGPTNVYRTTRSIGPDLKVTMNYNLMWIFEVNFT
ncbi:receptor-like protein kinase ANXUR1 [Canna indica]|uniref:Receptor-like protein kinase ANXUR1 n=1 Tax=Canna indica TaxID=4628 RepID=A0AAQ3JX05_9LILI|nr:receptor-like protein kinase ANXUR1 [Canna indica]